MRRTLALVLFTFLASALVPASAQVDFAPKVHARLIPERDGIAPGESLTIALEENIRPGWHTYWINPGDAGAPTQIQWSLPEGWRPQAIQWPYPKNLPVGPLMDYGYEGRPWLLTGVTAPKTLVPGQTVLLKAAVSWLVCKEVCIPEDATLTLPLKTVAQRLPPDPAVAAAFAATRAKLPVASPWPARYRLANKLSLFLAAPQLERAKPVSAVFYPLTGTELHMSAPETFDVAKGGLVLDLVPAKHFHAGSTLTGVLVLTSRDGSVQALNVSARQGFVPETAFINEGSMTIALSLLFAFLGGLILNLMPCVLPVLAMKALAVASHGGAARRELRLEALNYGVGAVLTFVALGLFVLTLRAGGAEIGWGFQLQEPIVVAGFALLMFAVGLNLSGVYEINPIAAGETLTRRGGTVGAFFTGVLAVAVAAPCTAPFMAAALGFAFTQSNPVALGIFVALGLGFAAPFVLLGLSGAGRFLPRPGRWMITVKQALAFPMYAAAAWLTWVLTQETNATGVAAALAAIVLFGFAMWLWTSTRGLKSRGRAIGVLATLIGLVASFSCLAVLRTLGPAHENALSAIASPVQAEPYSEARLSVLRAARHPVFVDATAAWCVTCLVNDEAVLSRPVVREAFARDDVAFLLADWTNRNAEIASLLSAHGRSGVPLYLYYAPGADQPVVLPQILTEREVLSVVGSGR